MYLTLLYLSHMNEYFYIVILTNIPHNRLSFEHCLNLQANCFLAGIRFSKIINYLHQIRIRRETLQRYNLIFLRNLNSPWDSG